MNNSLNEKIKELLKYLLDSEKVDSVFGLGRFNDGYSYALVTEPDEIDALEPLTPVMPVNAANLLSMITARSPLRQKIAAIIRPCELRAFAERVKRQQGYRDNFVLISPVCSGVFDSDRYLDGDLDKLLPEYWKSAAKLEMPEGIRETCTACVNMVPSSADITILPTDKGIELFAETPAGTEILEGAPGEIKTEPYDKTEAKGLLEARESAREKLYTELGSQDMGFEGLVDIYGRCIGCHGCSAVCPICYCDLCAFESKEHEFVPRVFEGELGKRGAIRVPPNTVFYHLGRMTHMAVSCVGCGMCSDVCPVDIPISTVFMRVGERIQKLFDYVPGADFDEPVPLLKFELEEFSEVET